MKLSSKQKEIIKLMRGNYILKSQCSFGLSYWLTKDIKSKEFHYLKSYDIRKATSHK